MIWFFPSKSLYFECYATIPMLTDAHIFSSLAYVALWLQLFTGLVVIPGKLFWLLSISDSISSCLIQSYAWHWVRKAAKRRSSSTKARWSESTSESTLNHKPPPCPTWTGHNKSKRKDIPAKVQLSHDMFAVGSFEVFLPKVSYLLFIYLPIVTPKAWLSRLQIENLDLTPTHACVPICHAW